MTTITTETVPVFDATIPDIPDSPPFEIAWATPASGGIACESRLIRPKAAWAPPLVRHPLALRAYSLKLKDLHQFGLPTHELAEHMNDALAGRELFSATIDDDARIRWLFDAAKTEPNFELRKCDSQALVAELARMRRVPVDALARAKREAEVACLTGIRAEAKARYLATYWGFVAGRQ